MIRKRVKKQAGFTVLELLVVLGIMTLLLTISIANFKNFERDQKLEGDLEILISDIKQTQIIALTGQTISGLRYAYGLNFAICELGDESCSYRVFKNSLVGDKEYQEGNILSDGNKVLTSGIYISDIEIDGVPVTKADLVFMPPFVTDDIYINNMQTNEELKITITSRDTGLDRSIVVNRNTGQVKKLIEE